MWVIWFNWFSFVLFGFFSRITSQSEPYKFISHLNLTFNPQLVLFERNPILIEHLARAILSSSLTCIVICDTLQVCNRFNTLLNAWFILFSIINARINLLCNTTRSNT